MKSLNVTRMDWDKLRQFYLMAQYRSLSEAASQLGCSQSQMSRQLSDLEYRLGVKLFDRDRSQRSLRLLKDGEELLEVSSHIFKELVRYEANRMHHKNELQGPLRVFIPLHLPMSWLMQSTSRFLKQYPHINFHLVQQFYETDSLAQYADCGIQIREEGQVGDLDYHPLCQLHYGLYASSGYIAQRGMPHEPKVLKVHTKLILKADTDRSFGWPSRIPLAKDCPLTHNFTSAQGLLWAAEQGLGIAALPREQAASHPDLIRVLPQIEGPVVDLHFVYPHYYQDIRRIALYRNFLAEEMRTLVRAYDLPLGTG